ncbi:MAG: gliding motility-associated C-terminal domain-containing protein [Chitinophagaceae bacterium]|nr:gliding motility-associated C-terminal domain-containing protein [Chitinophagaceae bacterium]MCW5905992.1 gliding motility-associated C-terminal domain-containing protein [Chitinophagaceae bacterium]
MRNCYAFSLIKRFLLIVSVVVATSASLQAQIDINIGTGTATNTGTGYPAPLQDWYEGSRMQFLYTAAELQAAGMTSAGFISKIKFNVTSLNTFSGTIEEMQIKIGNTTATSLTNTWETTTPVYGPVDYAATMGVNEFVFTTPFLWDGVNNIVIEVCNGAAANGSGTFYTNNPSVQYSTVTFNASHTYRLDNNGNLCSAADIADNGLGSQNNRPNITFVWASNSPCSGKPSAGTATSTSTNITCAGTAFTLGLTPYPSVADLAFQWQSSPDNTTWTDISGATSMNSSVVQTIATAWYRCVVTCTHGNDKDTSTTIQVTSVVGGPVYATLPFVESFEPTWINGCGTRDIPNNSWKNTPATGNSSWRRNNDGGAATWTNPNNGAYNPPASPGNGSFSARFHTNGGPTGASGNFDLYVNAATSTPNKKVEFDFINANGADSLVIMVSTDGGATFTRLDTTGIATTWRKKVVFFVSSSATTVIRFKGTSDAGTSDIGLDNVRIEDLPDCSTTPAAGTASVTPPNVCPGGEATLNVTGVGGAGGGNTYKWQVSTDGGTTWTDVPGASWTNVPASTTNFKTTTTQMVTSKYRFVASCPLTGGGTNTSNEVTVMSPSIMNGTYTIDKTQPASATNFPSFAAAYSALNCGITGPVVFNVVTGTGPYNEQLIINGVIPGSSATNTITFNGNGETISFNSTNANERAVIKLKNTKHFIFDSLVVNASGGTYGFGFHLTNNADSNIIRKNTVNTSLTATTANYAGIVVSGADNNAVGTGTTTALCDNNKIDSNTVNGGMYGITLTATFVGGANQGNEITNNKVYDFYTDGIHVIGSSATIIRKNIISRPTRTNSATTVNGIVFNQTSYTAKIQKNKIYECFKAMPTNTATFNGMQFNNASPTAGNQFEISNNLIAASEGNGNHNGILNSGTSSLEFYHNTISLDNVVSTATSSITTRGYNQSGSPSGLIFYNNIVSIIRTGAGIHYAMYVSSNAYVPFADYNDYYVNPASNHHIGFNGANRTTLQAWVTATNQDLSSINYNPVFSASASGDYSPSNAAMNDKALPGLMVDDINDVVRSLTAPDIGAYEFTAPICVSPPVAGPTVITPTTACQNTQVFLDVTLAQYGSGQTFLWQRADAPTGPFTDVGNPKSSPDTLIMASITGYYRCAITCSGNTVYSDTVLLNVNPSLPAGTYTINNTQPTTYVPGVAGGNFDSYNATKANMGCGILGPVVFNVVANTGPYNEQLILDSIAGTSVVNTITYNGNGTTIAFTPTNGNERAVIKLNGADYIIFDSLTVDVSGSASFGFGIQLINNADTNIVRNSTIIASSTIASANSVGIVLNSSNSSATTGTGTPGGWNDGNKFYNNTITGGFYGIASVSTGTGEIFDNQFVNNKITDFYSAGIYLAGNNNALVEGNTISRPTRSSVGIGYGIYATAAANNKLIISKNRITNFFGGVTGTNSSASYGIYHNNVGVTSGNENTVSNNLIYQLDVNSTGATYGLYNTSSGGVNYYHNTIAIDNELSTSSAVATGFYQTGVANGLQFINNIISVTRTGNAQKFAIQLLTTANDIVLSNNNYNVSSASTNNFLGRYGSVNYNNLTTWQTATTKDANSWETDPLFISPSTGNYKPQSLQIDDKGIYQNISTDIENVSRSTTTPDIGAYEFVAAPCPANITAGTATVTPASGLCLEMPIHLDLTGYSALGSILFQWQYSMDGTTGWTNIGAQTFAPGFDTLTTAQSYYRCIVTCGVAGGGTDTSTVVQVGLNTILAAGSYTIDGTQPTTWPAQNPGGNFNTFQEAATALQCGIQGSVVFNVTGTYNEQIRIGYVPGTSANATITFKSANDNPASAELTYASVSAANNYTLKIDSTNYLYFKTMTIGATGTTFGKAVEFANWASNDSLVNCIINAPLIANTSTNFIAIHLNQLKGKNVVVKGNTVNNGSVGIYVTGTSAAIRTFEHIIEGNTVTGFFQYGIYSNFTSLLTLNGNTVNMSSPLSSTSTGIYTVMADSMYLIANNRVNMNNITGGNAYGIWVTGSGGSNFNRVKVMNNDIVAETSNTAILYGLRVTNSPNIFVANNTTSLNTSSSTYGIHIDNSPTGLYYNNTVNTYSPATTNGYGMYVLNSTATGIELKNNIIANKGGGRALFVTNPAGISSNYNMLYAAGTVLVQRGTPAATYANLGAWVTASQQDRYSISYEPAFISNTNLRPDLNDHNVWAMHGRGVQIADNNTDHDGNARPTTLIAGVPDLGAYEFYPNVAPTVLSVIPATPAPNTTQTFYYGTDTVMKISWKNTAPASIELQRYSGVVPSGLAAANLDSMYFYIQATIPGGGTYDYDAKLFYLDPWLGSVQAPSQLGIGRTTASNAWVVGVNSRNELAKRMLYDNDIHYMDRFTGLFNPYAPPVVPDRDSSNRGTHFYFAYAANQLNAGTSQQMTYYISTESEPANVTIRVNGTSWSRSFLVPPYSVYAPLPVDYLPKAGADNAFLNTAGIFDRSVEIISDVPVTAYAHAIGSTSSGGCMLMPVGVWGYEYKTLTITQNYGASSYSLYYVIADNDNTAIEITSVDGVPTQNTTPAIPAGTATTVILNKGQVLQVLATSQTQELSGSLVKSVPNANGECFPIAVFSGSSRTAIDMPSGCSSGGDFSMQQNFPITAWGKRYLLAPTSFSTAPFNSTSNPFATNVFRVAVQDPTTVVKYNDVPLTGIVNNHYYQFFSNQPGYIEADKPIMVAQFLGGGTCLGGSGVGDPEMIYISPIEQGIKEVGFYRNTAEAITINYLTMIVPTNALSSLLITDNGAPQTPDYTYSHPANGNVSLKGVNYTVVIKRWTSAQRQVRVTCDSAFTGITYGLGSVESYGYNMGTLVKSLRATGSAVPTTTSGTSNAPSYTCSKTETKITIRMAAIPTSIIWKFSNVPNISPNTDITDNNPTPVDSAYDNNGDKVYYFTVPQNFVFSAPGLYTLPITFTAPTIGSCDNSQTDIIYIHVIPSPEIGFNYTFAGCEGNTATFDAEAATPGGVNANLWNWTFHDNSNTSGQSTTYTYNAAGTFPVKLHVETADGCVGDSIRNILVNPLPTVDAVNDLIKICAGESVTFEVNNPSADIVYNWYTSTTSTTPVFTGTSYNLTNVTATQEFYIEGTNNTTGCISADRKMVKVEVYNLLTPPVVAFTDSTQNSVTFTWAAVAGATGYEVSTDNGTTWSIPSSGSTGLSHTVTGLAPNTTVTLIVRVSGTLPCQQNVSAPVTGKSISVYKIYVPNAFNPSSANPENRVFRIYGSVQTMQLMVFNQWGQKIFEANTPTASWDGTYQGKPVPSGVYIYVLRYSLIDGTQGEKKGSLNLIR